MWSTLCFWVYFGAIHALLAMLGVAYAQLIRAFGIDSDFLSRGVASLVINIGVRVAAFFIRSPDVKPYDVVPGSVDYKFTMNDDFQPTGRMRQRLGATLPRPE